ncbi:MAG TPA: glycosyltransferase [Clostridiales bacterium]|nr:glycosyltransferase [Clostridiales bacterium]
MKKAANKYKISVYAIAKNERKFVSRWATSTKDADEIVVLDTGSCDETVELLKSRGVKIIEQVITPWRFDAARNIALDNVSLDTDICISLDLDEVLEQGWRQKLENSWGAGVTRARYTFACSHDSKGNVIKTHPIEKIHSRFDYKWINPVHEVLKFIGKNKENIISIPELVVHHFPDYSKPREQYLPLLELSAQENPEEPSISFWLGREYYYNQRYDDAIKELNRYLSLKSAVWEEERSAALRFLSRCYLEKKDIDNAKIYLYQALAQCPYIREPYLDFAKIGYMTKDWPLAYWACFQALKITDNTGSYLIEEEAWGYAFFDYGAIACFNLGLIDQALKYAEQAYSLAPDDFRLKKNLNIIRKKTK